MWGSEIAWCIESGEKHGADELERTQEVAQCMPNKWKVSFMDKVVLFGRLDVNVRGRGKPLGLRVQRISL